MDFELPPVGEGLFEVELIRWLVKPGESISRGQSLMEVMSDKAAMDVPAPFEGVISETLAEPGVKIQVGQKILRYLAKGELPSSSSEPKAVFVEAKQASSTAIQTSAAAARSSTAVANGHADGRNRLPAAAPSVRLLARKLGVDLCRVHGTGPAGRVLLEDLSAFVAPQQPKTKDEAKEKKSAVPKMDLGVAGSRVKMMGIRRKIAEKMTQSKRTIPHIAYVDECDLSDLVRLRNQLKETFAVNGIRITYLPFFVKAVARALKEVPVVNSTYDEANQEIIMNDRYDLGIAVAAPSGLMVPVVREADKKDIATLAGEIDRLSAEARAGRAKLEDLRNGTFTITSIGGIGGLISTPIINHPEVAIMGIGKVVKKPIYDEHGKLRPADMVYLSFSFDHRVVDGAVGAVFGNAVIRHLQNPASLLLPEKFGK